MESTDPPSPADSELCHAESGSPSFDRGIIIALKVNGIIAFEVEGRKVFIGCVTRSDGIVSHRTLSELRYCYPQLLIDYFLQYLYVSSRRYVAFANFAFSVFRNAERHIQAGPAGIDLDSAKLQHAEGERARKPSVTD